MINSTDINFKRITDNLTVFLCTDTNRIPDTALKFQNSSFRWLIQSDFIMKHHTSTESIYSLLTLYFQKLHKQQFNKLWDYPLLFYVYNTNTL